MDELPFIPWLIWVALAVGAGFAIRNYFRRKRNELGYWQFTIKQIVVLMTVWTLLAWILYLRFGPERR